MAFESFTPPTIAGKGAFSINLYTPDETNPDDVQSGKLDVQVKMSDGRINVLPFDLLERLTDDAAGQIHLTNLVALRNYISARIDAEVIVSE